MTKLGLTSDQLVETLLCFNKYKTVSEVARQLDIGRSAVQHRMSRVSSEISKGNLKWEMGKKPKILKKKEEKVAPQEDPMAEWRLEHGSLEPAFVSGDLQTFYTKEDNTFTFGACGDQHLGSKYSRLDVLNNLYDIYEETNCEVVFNTGNWVDGEARFNVHDLEVHGVNGQIKYLAEVYPRRENITTYAVTGDDHEGWWSQREGIDVGRYAERTFRDLGRKDWVDLGFMEAPCRLININTGKEAIISVVHPGGGSAYATSYSIQKIVESLDGGEKPHIGLYGHYHKLWSGNIRNVWVVQTGTSQDQTPFLRKKKIEVHVGGTLCRATMDPKTGAIVRFSVELIRYFNKGYYKNRWSHSGEITQSQRLMGRT